MNGWASSGLFWSKSKQTRTEGYLRLSDVCGMNLRNPFRNPRFNIQYDKNEQLFTERKMNNRKVID